MNKLERVEILLHQAIILLKEERMNVKRNELDLDATLNAEEAAQFIRYRPWTLQAWRCRGKGPPFIKILNGHIRYKKKDLIEWERKRNEKPSSIDPANIRFNLGRKSNGNDV